MISKAIKLSGGQATVVPPTVATVRMLLPVLKRWEDTTLLDFLIAHFDDLVPAVKDCLQLPSGMKVDNMTAEDFLEFWRALREVSPDFFKLIAGISGLGGLMTLSESLIDPAPSSSSGDTAE